MTPARLWMRKISRWLRRWASSRHSSSFSSWDTTGSALFLSPATLMRCPHRLSAVTLERTLLEALSHLTLHKPVKEKWVWCLDPANKRQWDTHDLAKELAKTWGRLPSGLTYALLCDLSNACQQQPLVISPTLTVLSWEERLCGVTRKNLVIETRPEEPILSG